MGGLGMEGRGFYLGGDIGGLNAEWSRNGGWNYGFEEELVGLNYNDQSSSLLSASLFGRYSTTLIGPIAADIDIGGEGTFAASGHGVYNKEGKPVGKINLQGKDQIGAEEFVKLLPKWGYKKGQDILLISCENAILAKQISELVPDIVATGATTKVRYSPILNFLFGIKYWLQGNGTWNSYQNGNLIGTVKD